MKIARLFTSMEYPMSQTCPTVKVKSDNELGFVIINQADFKESEHELFDAVNSEGAKVLTIGQMRDELTARGIEFDPKAKKSELAALLAQE
jgi:uncharacterized protein (DUF302 family)